MKKLTGLIIVIALICVSFYFQKKIGVFFDTPYEDIIKTYSQTFSTDPLLIKAVIKRESNVKPDALSPKGAVGLMQIMPNTAKEIAAQLEVKDYIEYMLKDPDLNIKFGTYYLSFLMSYYKNNLILALAAYNAGIGNVDAWIAREPDVKTSVLKIPFKETKRHTRAILFTYRIYKIKEKIGRAGIAVLTKFNFRAG
ncbi:MAG: lytic transglycosylase domain-containing protein [Endomicrobium sp.]|jgi:soluble lytic murein transglycosylase|nr:lytic transglycosylase domain-containing protein [Endomicrobium sp.]